MISHASAIGKVHHVDTNEGALQIICISVGFHDSLTKQDLCIQPRSQGPLLLGPCGEREDPGNGVVRYIERHLGDIQELKHVMAGDITFHRSSIESYLYSITIGFL